MAWINKKTYEVVQRLSERERRCDFFEVDDLIALPVALLNSKGWRTKWACAGHPYPTLFWMNLGTNEEFLFDDPDQNLNIANLTSVCCRTYNHRRAYITFQENIKLPISVPEGWSRDMNTKTIFCDFSKNISALEFCKRVILKIEELMEWINDLNEYTD